MHVDVLVKVEMILGEVFAYRGHAWEQVADDEPLTGDAIALSASEMVFLCYALEARFQIRFSEDSLVNYGLLTLKGIRDEVEKAMGARKEVDGLMAEEET